MTIQISNMQAKLLARYPRAMQFWQGALTDTTVVVRNPDGTVRVIRQPAGTN
jgi:hypothetical protein